MKQKWLINLGIGFLTFGFLGLFINSWNAKYFGLQNAVVAALVNESTFALVDQVIPGFNLVEGDETFRFAGKVFPMKQPGQAVVGALVYYPLQALGVDFVHHYDYASNLITWLTSGLAVAILAVSWYHISGTAWAPLILVVASPILPYSGVSHHDILAMSTLGLAIAAAAKAKMRWSGVALGLTYFFSMLPLSSALALVLGVWWHRSRQQLYQLLGGLSLGLIPSLAFNYWQFGNPLLFPNLAGKVADTTLYFDWQNLVAHYQFYLFDYRSALIFFAPILLLSWPGMLRLWRESKLLATLTWLQPTLLLLHLSLQQTFGGYQYGPRYLLPAIPILVLAASWQMRDLKAKWLGGILLGWSAAVAIIGALTTVMQPIPEFGYPPLLSWQLWTSTEGPEYRLRGLGFGVMLLGLAILQRALKHHHPVGSLDRQIT